MSVENVTSESIARGLVSGRTLGEFVLRERIGVGGFGIVFRAEQPLLAREAVIKVLSTRQSEHDVSVQRFLREARLASQLDHPFAAHIYAFGIEQDGLLWIAMEYVRGTPLDQWLKRHGAFTPRAFAPFLDRLADVVHTAHERKIVHRDIKPSNVMVLQRAGKLLPKLLDLGIAKVADADAVAKNTTSLRASSMPGIEFFEAETMEKPAAQLPAAAGARLTQEGAVIGSPGYIAPELWSANGTADARSDLYALGVLAYESIVGQLPFRGVTLAALADAHLHAPVPPCRIPELDEFFARALAKSPADRFPTALELATQFRTAIGANESGVDLPRLMPKVRDAFVTDAPEPLAELVAVLDSADTALQARDALLDLLSMIARTLSVLALAAHTRSPVRDHISVDETLRDLRRHELPDAGWIGLARSLCQPYANDPQAHPLPDLVRWLCEDSERFEGLWHLRERPIGRGGPALGGERQVREWLAAQLPQVSRLLDSLDFVLALALVVRRNNYVQRWNGQRRRNRSELDTADLAQADASADGHPVVLDRNGKPLVRLWPLVQVVAPTAGSAVEMFVLDGPGRQGARLRSASGFTVESHEVWEWLSTELMASASEEERSLERDKVPYRGLAAFHIDHADRFVGREREVMECANRLKVAQVLCVVGPSGSGKSSLVHAGIVPALPAEWTRVLMRPGPAPIAAFAARCDALPPDRPCVVVIDQLEELFTMCRAPAEQNAFAAAVGSLVRLRRETRLVFTLRDDFLMAAETLFGEQLALGPGLFLLTPPRRAELVRMVVEPSRRAGYGFDDPKLVNEMVDAVEGQAGALPLLSFTALQLWDKRDVHFRRLTRRAYDAIGGVTGALARHADDVLASMPNELQRLVREAFRHLVSAEGTRTVLTRAELLELLGARGSEVIERLLEARLVVASEGEQEDRIEIIHEALVTSWPRLAAWRQEDSEGAHLRDELRSAARQWDARGRKRGMLWRDETLAELRAWRSRAQPSLTALEVAFAAASDSDAARARRLRRGVVAAIISVLGAAVALLFWANTRTQAAQQESQHQEQLARDTAAREHERVLSQQIEQGRLELLAGHASEALRTFGEAYRNGAKPTPTFRFLYGAALQPLEARIATLRGHSRAVETAEFSPDGTQVITASDDGTVRLWDAATGQHRKTLTDCPGKLVNARYAPTGAWFVAACDDSTVRLYRPDGALLRTLVVEQSASSEAVVLAVASPDGKLVATADGGSIVTLWDAATGTKRWSLHTNVSKVQSLVGLEFDRRGTMLATTGGAKPELWDVASGHKLRELAAAEAVSLDFDPTGTRLVTSSFTLHAAQIWDVRSGALVRTLIGHTGWVTDARFDADGALIATAGRDNTVRVWRAATGELLYSMASGVPKRILQSPGMQFSFSPSGNLLALVSQNGSVLVWDARTGTRLATLQGRSALQSVAFHRDGVRLVTAAIDGTAAIWSRERGAIANEIMAHQGPVAGVAPTTQGSVVSWGADGAVNVWELASGRRQATLSTSAPIEAGAAVDDGAVVVVGNDAGQVLAWKPGSPPRRLAGHAGPVLQVALRGALVATSGQDDAALVSDLATGTVKARLAGHDAPVWTVAFAGDGQRLVTGDRRGHAWLWEATGKQLATLSGHTSDVYGAVFARDGRIVTASWDASARLWSAHGELLRTFAGHTSRIVRIAIDDAHDRLLTASTDGTARIWDLATGRSLVLPHSSELVYDAQFTRDGGLVVTVDDTVAHLWDPESGRELLRFEGGHASLITQCRFSIDGTELVTSDGDGKLVIWRLPTPATDAVLATAREHDAERDR